MNQTLQLFLYIGIVNVLILIIYSLVIKYLSIEMKVKCFICKKSFSTKEEMYKHVKRELH